MGDAMAKEVNAPMTELAPGDVDDQAVLPKSLEQLVKMIVMCLNVPTCHQNVVDVDKNKI